jgi:hypothetical protein
MNASQPEKLVPPADRNRGPSAGDTANPDELVANFGIASPQISAVALVMLILSGFSALAKVYDSDGSVARVQALHNAASDGDTITLPAGTFSWTSRLDITKGIMLQGATTITGAGTGFPRITDATIIKDNTPRTQQAGGIIRVSITPSQSCRITGLTFQPGIATNSAGPAAIILASSNPSPVTSIRVDHCHFARLYSRTFWINGWVYGVSDHNVIELRGNNQGFTVQHNTYGGPSQINGNGSWADYPWYGTDKFWFIEDNTIIGNGGQAALDSFSGGRWVARHNYWKNAIPSGHGTEGGVARGQRVNEFYDNTVESKTSGGGGGQRSGTSLWHDNTYIGVEPLNDHLCSLANYRESHIRSNPIWGIADGTSPWDANDTEGNGTFIEGHPPFVFDSGTATSDGTQLGTSGTLIDATKNWTPNQWVGYSLKATSATSPSYPLGSYITANTSDTITYRYEPIVGGRKYMKFFTGDAYKIHRVLIMMDQNGRGKTDQIIGTPKPVLQATRQPGWPHSALEPCYSWNNIYTPNGHVLGYFSSPRQPTTKDGIDYFNLGGGFAADTTPSAVSKRYTAALNGVAYTGPFVYPHPLVTGAPTPTPSATPRSQQHLQKKKKNSKKLKGRKGGQKNRRVTWLNALLVEAIS